MARTDDVNIRLRLLGAREVVRGTTAASRSISGMGKKIDKVGAGSVLMAQGLETGRRGARALGTALKYTGLAAGALAAIEIPRMLNAAVDLGEQQNKTRVVFEQSSKGILRWSANTASALGISSREALEASGVFGNMLVPMGIAEERAAKMSKRLVTLAADMASFNNKNPAEVLDALRAGLAGETEPLRALGVFLSAERVGLEATKKGLADNYTELTANQKAQLAYGLILQDTIKAQGDFGRTSDSLANRQRMLKAQLEGVEAQLGKGLIPIFEDLADVAADSMDKVSKILDNDDLTGEQKFNRIMGVIDGLVEEGIEKLEDYMPMIAEAGAGLGGRLAVSLGKAFLASNIWGKLFIGAWLAKILFGAQGGRVLLALGGHMGKKLGIGLIKILIPSVAAEMATGSAFGQAMQTKFSGLGKVSGRAFAVGVVLGVALLGMWIGKQIADSLSIKTKLAMQDWGRAAGQNFVNGLITAVNWAIDRINQTFDEANFLSAVGVDAPNIGRVGDVNLERSSRDAIPGWTPPKGAGTGINSPKKGAMPPRDDKGGREALAGWSSRRIEVPVYLNGRQIALAVADEAGNSAAFK